MSESNGHCGDEDWTKRASSTHELLSFVISRPIEATEHLQKLRKVEASYVELIAGFRDLFVNLVEVIDEAIGAKNISKS